MSEKNLLFWKFDEVSRVWHGCKEEDADVVTDLTKIEVFKAKEETELIQNAVKMKLPRHDYYDKVVSYQPEEDFAERRIRVVGLLPRGRKYNVLGRNHNGTEIKMPLSVLDQLN